MSVWSKIYERINWKDLPQRLTALAARNLNKMDLAIDTLDDRTIGLNTRLEAVEENPITVDTELKPDSENPVQNKVIYAAFEDVLPEVTVEGNPISITDGSDLVGAKLAEVTFLPKQSGSGEPSPDNVRPISGWTEVNLYVDEEQTLSPATTYTESLGSTYYGGKVDFVSGEGQNQYEFTTLTSVGGVSQSGGLYYTYTAGFHSYNTANVISSHFKQGNLAVGNCYITGNGATLVFVLPDQTITTREQANTWLQNNNVQFAIPLATPTTLTLTAQQIELLKGANVLWSDSNGNIKLTYSADIAQYIANQLNS